MIDIYTGVKLSIEAERSVIGAIIINPDEIMPECEQMLDEDDFLVGEYRALQDLQWIFCRRKAR